MLGRLLSGFITILVGVTILPTVATQVAGAQANANVTGAANTVTGLITLFYALGVMTAGVAIAVGGLRDAGLM